MSYLLDVLGATAIGGYILLLLLQVNMQISESLVETIYGRNTQMSAYTSTQIMEYDFYKIGYRVSGEKIAVADSNEIQFSSDMDNNGTPEMVTYSLGTVNEMASTKNPKDFPLYRQINGGSKNLTNIVTKFMLTYYDSSGSKIDYSLLSSINERRKIKSILIDLKFEASDSFDTIYQAIEWDKVIRPKNLN